MTNIKEDQDRQARLEELYEEDGRQDPGHPMHCLYTGLWQQYMAQQEAA